MVTKSCIICGKDFNSKKNAKTCLSELCRKTLRKRTRKELYLKRKTYFIDYAKNWSRKNPESRKKSHNEWILKKQAQIKAILGEKCAICKSVIKIQYHEKRGLKHEDFGNLGSNPNYILKNIENFVPLCFLCHRSVHFLSRTLEIDENLLLSFIKEIKEGKN